MNENSDKAINKKIKIPLAVIIIYAVAAFCALLYLLLIPVCYASVKLKRHTMPQLVSGALIPIVSIVISFFIFT